MTEAAPRTHRRMGQLSVVAFALAAFLLVAVAAATRPEWALAHCVPHDKNQTLLIGADRFRNFDYTSTGDGDCNVDWPVDFLFWQDAAVGKVKNRMATIGYDDDFLASTMWHKQDNGGGWEWNGDPGKKNPFAFWEYCTSDVEHYRVYAVGDNSRNYNMHWGYYVLGTAHVDHQERCEGWSGRSELAENRIADDIRDAGAIGLGGVCKDCSPFYNHMDFAVADDGHRKENSGGGTSVIVRP